MTIEPEETLKRRQDTKTLERLRRLFSTNELVRTDAQSALKESWCFEEPSFRVDELANHPAENCTILAAIRDGNKEVVEWMIRLSKLIQNTEDND